jgi:hypothetical protein
VSNRVQDGGTKWFGFVNNDRFRFSYGGNDRDFLTTINANTWNHVAFVVTSSTVTCYSNGTQVGSTQAAPTSLTLDTISGYGTAGMIGYLSNFRIVNGVAVYTGAFTTPTSPLQKTQAGNGSTIQAITGSQTSLLTCQSNRFIDNSNGAIVITPSGSPQVTPYFYPSGFTAPAASPGAALFNGSSQYLSSPSASGGSLDITSGNFTLEAWIYPTSFNSVQSTIIGTRGAVGNNWEFRTNPAASPSNALQFYFTSTTYVVTSSVVPPLNAWSHVVAVRSSNTVTLYLNGVSVGSNASFGNGISTAATLLIGIETAAVTNDAFPGYIGNLRIVKGTAVYTGAFTPPSGPLTQTGGTYPSTLNVNTSIPPANTSLLLNLADSNYLSATDGVQNKTFIDDSNYAFPITRNGTLTQGSITPYWPNGQWSNFFNGSSDYLTAPSSSAFAFGTNDFSVSFWFYPNQLPTATNAGLVSMNFTNGFHITVDGTSTYFFIANSSIATSSIRPTLNAWNYIVCSRSSGVATIYLNGTQRATGSLAGSVTNSQIFIGRSSHAATEYANGYLSNVLISNVASVGTVPTIPATPVSSTRLLTCQSNRFKDNSTANAGGPFTITANGTPRVQAFQPFSPTESYTTALYGGSGYFNGSSDFLTFTDSTNVLDLGNATASLEMWLYFSNSGPTIIRKDGGASNYNTTNGTEWVFAITGSLAFVFYSNSGGSSQTLTDSVTRIYNSWYHVVIATNATTQSLYVNGTRTATLTAGITKPTTRTSVRVGSDLGSSYFSGYISNMRFIQGTGAYDASQTTITVPTAPVTAVTNTSLLLNMTNAGIYDAAVQNNLITVGDAQVSIAQAQFPPTSMKFTGTTEGLAAIDNPQLQLGTGDFTIEGWFYLSLNNTAYGIVSKGAASTGWSVNVTSGNRIQFSYTAANLTGSTTTLAQGSWYYFAVVRSGTATGNLKIYLNGNLEVTSGGAVNDNFNQTNILYVGSSRNGTTALNGYLQDIRITKAARIITAQPSAPFPTR